MIIYLVAGLRTPEHFFTPLREALKSRFEADEQTIVIRTLFPYGGEKDGVMKQLYEIRRDTRLYPEQAGLSLGGQRTRKQVKMLGAKDPVMFIGHDGGGVAAYHAAELLAKQDGCDVRFIVQVGSPKVAIGDDFKDRVGFVAKKGPGFEGDPFSWQGTWAHAKYRYNAHRYPGLLYNAQEKRRRFYAPVHVEMIDILGQHPSYFSPAKGKGAVSNLAKMMNVIWPWLQQASNLRPL